MTALDRLNEIAKRLKQLETDTHKVSNFAMLTELASFMDDLPDITQQLESAIIELEG